MENENVLILENKFSFIKESKDGKILWVLTIKVGVDDDIAIL